MSGRCKNNCTGKPFGSFNRYNYKEMKYCATCARWVTTSRIFCPCCNVKLRIKTRVNNYAQKNKTRKIKLIAEKQLTSIKLNKKQVQ